MGAGGRFLGSRAASWWNSPGTRKVILGITVPNGLQRPSVCGKRHLCSTAPAKYPRSKGSGGCAAPAAFDHSDVADVETWVQRCVTTG